MKKKIKKIALTIALIQLLQSNFALAKEDISFSDIFNQKNDITKQYGGNQGDFSLNFNKLINNPLILEIVVSSWGERFLYGSSESSDNYCIRLTYK